MDKVIAVLAMALDHIGIVLLTDYDVLRHLGRVAFPLFAFAVAKGCFYTRNRLKYASRLIILGLISQPFYILALGGPLYYLNICFLFGLTVLTIEFYKRGYLALSVLTLALSVFCEYGIIGACFVIACYGYVELPTKPYRNLFLLLLMVIPLFLQGFIYYPFTLVGVLLSLYLFQTPLKKPSSSTFFYRFYPLHFIVLFMIGSL